MIKRKKTLYFYYINILILFIILFLLIWLRFKFKQEMNTTVKSVKSHFPMETLVKSPDDIQINFSRISEAVKNNLRNPFIKDLYVSKIIRGKGEHLIYPFYYSATDPEWKETLHGDKWISEPLLSNEKVYGYLYISLDKSALHSVDIAAASISIFLIISILLFMLKTRAQEIVITKTTVELQEKEKELIHLERLALAGRLTANIFHDIKKPILNIKHEITDFEEGIKTNEKCSILSKNIKNQIDLYLSILRELNIERFVKADDDSEREYSSINDLVERSVNLVRYERGDVNIVKEYDINIVPILVNLHQIIQVLSNIVLNAYQAMGAKGELKIKTYMDENYVYAVFTDSGPGIPSEIKSNIFNPFFTTKEKNEGSGLGLYISLEIIKKHNGNILIESEEGKGTSFKVILPAIYKND